jgi:hypothetical protein
VTARTIATQLPALLAAGGRLSVTFQVASRSRPGHQWPVTFYELTGELAYRCPCPGFENRFRCRHGEEIESRLAALKPSGSGRTLIERDPAADAAGPCRACLREIDFAGEANARLQAAQAMQHGAIGREAAIEDALIDVEAAVATLKKPCRTCGQVPTVPALTW